MMSCVAADAVCLHTFMLYERKKRRQRDVERMRQEKIYVRKFSSYALHIFHKKNDICEC